jgi:hypothetical protein
MEKIVGFQHEYGHYLQSQASGGLYLFVFGLPSILGGEEGHNNKFPEQDANIRSWLWFNSQGIKNSWNTSNFEIGGRGHLDWKNPNHFQHVLNSRQITNYLLPNFWW